MYLETFGPRWSDLPHVSILDGAQSSETAQEEVRRYVPEVVRQAATHRAALQTETNNLWWYFEITEKSAYRGAWIQQLFFIGLIAATLKENNFDEMWVDVTDPAFAQSLEDSVVDPRIKKQISGNFPTGGFKFLARSIYHSMSVNLQALGRSLIVKALHWTHFIPKNSYLIFSFFPLWWDRAFQPNARDRFWADIPKSLAKETSVGFLVWTHLSLSSLWKRRKELSRVFQEGKVIPVEGFLSWRDCFSFLNLNIQSSLLKFFLKVRTQTFKSFQGFNVSPIILNEIGRSLGSKELWSCLLLEKASLRLQKILAPRAFLFRQEFQPWEAAFVTAFKGKVPLIGFQHAAIGRNHLAYSFYEGEIDERPVFTDLIICTGNHFPKKVAAQGFPANRLAVCGPARYKEMYGYFSADRHELRRRHSVPASAKVFFTAMPIDAAEMKNVLMALKTSLKGADVSNLYCFFKCHPAADYTAAINEFLKVHLPALPARILPHGVPIYEFITLSDVLLSAGTTMTMEAVCLDVMPIVFEDVHRFSVNPMLEGRDAFFCATNVGELAAAIKTIVTNPAAVTEKKKHWPAAIRSVFDRVDQDPLERFVQILKERGLLTTSAELVLSAGGR